MDVKIVLRIPKVKEPVKDAQGYPIDNALVRFTKQCAFEKVPQQDEAISVTVKGRPHGVNVTRVEWSESENIFMVSCQYGQRSIPQPVYLDLIEDPDWTMKPLLQ